MSRSKSGMDRSSRRGRRAKTSKIDNLDEQSEAILATWKEQFPEFAEIWKQKSKDEQAEIIRESKATLANFTGAQSLTGFARSGVGK